MSLCWVRDGLITWIYSYLEVSRGSALSSDTTSLVGGAVTLGGFFGGVLCGVVSDYIFDGNRASPILMFSAFQCICLGLVYYFAACNDAIVFTLMFLTATFMLGNYTLLSYTIPTDLPGPIVATAAGIMTAAGYLSSGLAGLGLGKLIQMYGWYGWFISLELATALASLAIFCGSIFSSRAKKAKAISLIEGEDKKRKKRLSKFQGIDQRSSDKLDTLAFVFIGGEAQVFVPPVSKSAVRMSGVQDEFLRARVGRDGTSKFYLWSGQGTVGERISWKLASLSPNIVTRDFLRHRAKDPSSYFGSKNSGKVGAGKIGESKISPF